MPRIEIDRMGTEGDGMGLVEGRPVFVPGALPGETVEADGDGPVLQLKEILIHSKSRRHPQCDHFGSCGGCVTQHAGEADTNKWKMSQVALAFSKHKLSPKIEPLISVSERSRRRITFTCKRENGEIRIGFKRRDDTEFVPIEHCHIILPSLDAEIPQLAQLAKCLIKGNEEIQLAINVCDNGIDVNVLMEAFPNESITASFVRAMAKTDYLRASINGDIVLEKLKPMVRFGRVEVSIPPGGFLQAAKESQESIVNLVCKHLSGRKRILDLFCGSGTFSLPLAEQARVHSVEADDLAVKALKQAPLADGMKTVTVEKRDLYELPLTVAELKPYDGVCIDPPRSGALDQIKQIAKAEFRSIAYVSCNPETLARDSAQLVKAGYVLNQVVPIDQFLYSPHVEVVALFSKVSNPKARSIFR